MNLKLKLNHEEENEGINITPLIDVVFLLLVFFLLTSQFNREEAKFVELPELPEAGGKNIADSDNSILILVDEDGRFFVDGTEYGLDGFGNVLKDREQSSIALLEADTAAPHGRILQLIARLQELGLSNIAFVGK